MKIEVGQIWEVTSDCFLPTDQKEDHNRPVKLATGEKIEIRYPYEWHFRTEDNFYFHATPEMISQNCMLPGVICSNVRSANSATLEEILRLRLFEKVMI